MLSQQSNPSAVGTGAGTIPKLVTYAFIDEPPFGAPGADGTPVGYDWSVAVAVFRRMGIAVDTKLVAFGDLIPGVVEGKWAINTGMFVTRARSEQVIFSRPIWALIDGFVVKAGNPLEINSYLVAAHNPGIVLGGVRGNVQIGVLPLVEGDEAIGDEV